MPEDIKTTRSEFLKLRKKYILAKNGHNLLKKKRDGLVMEFFNVLKKAKGMKKEISVLYSDVIKKMQITEMYDGPIAIKSAALYLKNIPLDIETRNLMGVKVPKIKKKDKIQKSIYERGYGLINASAKINNVTRQYECLLEKIIDTSEIETTLRKILIEIEKTKRRVNALEYIVIPKIKNQISIIKIVLEEQERENIFRLKMIKKP